MQGAIPILKLNRLDTHDRYQSVTSKDFDIGACCQDIINKRPFGEHAFYIFAHTRTEADGFTKRLIWQPRLTKPISQSNSMLFKAYPGTDVIKILWMIPDKALWGQYERGMVAENKLVTESIYKFVHQKGELDAKEEDDLNDDQINAIYRELCHDANLKRASSGASSALI